MPAVRLEALRKLRVRDAMPDDEMVRVQRANLIDPMAPNPSVETLLHAFVPHKYVDHTHSSAVLGLIDQPNGPERAREVYGTRMGVVPYILPGFGLAKKSAEVFDADPKVDGLILEKHGIFTFGADAREAYERMIELVTLAEDRLTKNRKVGIRQCAIAATSRDRRRYRADCARRLRHQGRQKRRRVDAAHSRFPHERRDPEFRQRQGRRRLCQRGVITPDHTIRTKNWPLVRAGAERRRRRRTSRAGTRQAVAAFVDALPRLFRTQQCPRRQQPASCSTPPRASLWCRASACSAWARNAKAAGIAADLARSRGRNHYKCRSHRPLRVDLRSRHVRLRILAARTGQARLGQALAAGRSDRRHHRRRWRDRRGHRDGLCESRRGSRPARPRSCRRPGASQNHRRRRAGARMRRHRRGVGAGRLRPGGGAVRRRRHSGLERRRRLARQDRRSRRERCCAKVSN